MRRRLEVLLVEDREEEGELTLREVARAGYEVEHRRVQTEADFRAALQRSWDVILCDFSMPGFGARAALGVVRELEIDLPFIIVSGTIGEETAVDTLKAGAHDFLVKGRLARLVPAIEREMREHAQRRERRETQARLRVIEERFRRLAQSLEDFVYTLDRDARFDGVYGRSAIRGGDVEPAFYLGRTFADVLGPESGAQHDEPTRRALAGEVVRYEWTYRDEDASLRHFHNTVAPQRDGAAIVGVVGIGREITAQKRLQEQVLVSDRMASVGMLAAGVAHEINNPLAAVIGNLEVAAEDAHAARERGEPLDLAELSLELDDALDSARRLKSIVKDLKIFSRADEEEARQAVELARVLDSALRMAWNEVRHRAKVTREYGKVPPVLANESRLGQVFLNLIVNAAHAIADGHAEENTIRLATSVDGDGHVVVEVQDSGAGMPPEVLKRLFTPFFTTKPIGVGTGLGLTICQQIVGAAGGRISVQSEVGKGTTFRVTLPALRDYVPAAPEAPRAVRAPVATGKRPTLLVVDDERTLCEVVRRVLGRQLEITTTTVARDALGMIAGGARFDVVLCDLMMPDLAGMDLYEEIRKIAPEQAEAMVFMTGGGFTPRARQFLDEVESRRIEKPFDPASLRKLVHDCLHRGLKGAQE